MTNTKNGGGLTAAISQILAGAALFALFWGVLEWGLKLETDKDQTAKDVNVLTDRVARIEAAIEPGVLNVAATRIRELERRVAELEKDSHAPEGHR